jgi:hypothetical protein
LVLVRLLRQINWLVTPFLILLVAVLLLTLALAYRTYSLLTLLRSRLILDANGNCTLPARLTINNVTLASSANTSNLVVGGALGFSDTGLASNFVATHPSYYQAAIQNLSNGSSATSEFIAYNDTATATTNYAAFGMNSSGYTGTGAINSPNHAFFVSASNDIVVGTISNNNIHFVTNSSATDAVTINGVGAIAVNGSFGTAGQALVTNGAGAPPSWTDSPADTAYFLSFMMG